MLGYKFFFPTFFDETDEAGGIHLFLKYYALLQNGVAIQKINHKLGTSVTLIEVSVPEKSKSGVYRGDISFKINEEEK